MYIICLKIFTTVVYSDLPWKAVNIAYNGTMVESRFIACDVTIDNVAVITVSFHARDVGNYALKLAVGVTLNVRISKMI